MKYFLTIKLFVPRFTILYEAYIFKSTQKIFYEIKIQFFFSFLFFSKSSYFFEIPTPECHFFWEEIFILRLKNFNYLIYTCASNFNFFLFTFFDYIRGWCLRIKDVWPIKLEMVKNL